MIPFPDKKYGIIYADPPWNGGGRHYSKLSPHVHYPLIDEKDLKLLPISEIAAEDCLLFMWATSPELDQAIRVGNAWGFDYITVAFVWDKQRTCPSFYTLSQIEQCLVFKRGKIPQPRGKRNVRQFLSEQ